RSSLRLPVAGLEFGFLLPAQERGTTDADCAGGVLGCPMREQRDNSPFFLSPEFCAVACHVMTPNAICVLMGSASVIAIPPPVALPSPSSVPAELTCLCGRSE